MKSVIIALGSRGDVEPYVALAARMSQAGYDVVVATHASMQGVANSHGVTARSVGGDPQEIVRQGDGLAWINSGSNIFQLSRGLYRVADKIFDEAFSNCLDLCRDAQLIIASRLAVIPATVIAHQTGARCIPAYVQPAHPMGAFPSIFIPFDVSFGSTGNRWSHILTEQVYWLLFRPLLKRWQAQFRGRNEAQVLGMLAPRPMIHGPGLLAVSPVVVPSSDEDPVRPSGYWVLDNSASWCPPPALVDFISAGSRPICIGFGSMCVPTPEDLAEIVRTAVKQARIRAIVLAGWGALQAITPDEDIFVLEQAPHAWLLPQVKMMIHHGGAGTVAACLRAGIPSVVVPFFADHMFWARRLSTLGVAPTSIPESHLTAARLASSIEQVSTNPNFGRRAARLAHRILAEDGPGEAIRVIDRVVVGPIDPV